MRQTTIIGIVAAIIIVAAGFWWWSNQQTTDGLTGTIEIDGSSTVFPITQAMAEEFQNMNSGVKINVGISVSRVGGSAQIKAMKQVAGRLRLDLAQFRELEAFAQFGSELDKATQAQLARGERTVEILKQGRYEPMSASRQVLAIYLVVNGHLDDIEIDKLKEFEREFLAFVESVHPDIIKTLDDERVISEETDGKIVSAIDEFKKGLD